NAERSRGGPRATENSHDRLPASAGTAGSARYVIYLTFTFQFERTIEHTCGTLLISLISIRCCPFGNRISASYVPLQATPSPVFLPRDTHWPVALSIRSSTTGSRTQSET